METWNKFWKEKGKQIEWTQDDILYSEEVNDLHDRVLYHLNKDGLKDASLLELGAGMGLTSFFFANHGAKVDLLDKSKEPRLLAKEYWGESKYNFIVTDLFTFEPKKKYDIVMSFGLCEHFIGEQRYEILQKHIDFLDDNGVAIISVPYKYGVFQRIAKKLAELTGFWSFGLEVPFSKKELVKFVKLNNLDYEIRMDGFYSSLYDLVVRKPLKVLKFSVKRRFEESKSIFDKYLGCSIRIILNRRQIKQKRVKNEILS